MIMRLRVRWSLTQIILLLIFVVLILWLAYLPVVAQQNETQSLFALDTAVSTRDSVISPATYYGWITPTAGFAPTVGMTVTAEISGTVCGETTIQDFSGNLGYVARVSAQNPFTPTGCGTLASIVSWRVDGLLISDTVAWDNSDAIQFNLTDIFRQEVAIALQSDDTELNWPIHPAVCEYDIHRHNIPYFAPMAGTSIQTTTVGTYLDTSALLTTPSYYIVQAGDCNSEIRDLNGVARFPFELIPGS